MYKRQALSDIDERLREADIIISSTASPLPIIGKGKMCIRDRLGGSLAAKFGRILHLDEKDARILTMCGMSAAFSALFGTPVTSAIFSKMCIRDRV